MTSPSALLIKRPCTIRTTTSTGARDAGNNPTRSTSSTSSLCYYREVSGAERTIAEDLSVTEYRVHLLADATVSATSQIDVDGLHLAVVGDPHVARDALSGEAWYIRCAAKATKSQ